MKMTLGCVLFLSLCGLSLTAAAENGCPAGYAPWRVPMQSMSDCVPMPDNGQPSRPVNPEQQWLTRWGAIAIGSTASGGGVGTSVDKSSRRKAEAEAMKACRQAGGGPECKVFSYHDQCAVVAWGVSTYVIHSAESVDVAATAAVGKCSTQTQDCQVFYSACSLPQPVR